MYLFQAAAAHRTILLSLMFVWTPTYCNSSQHSSQSLPPVQNYEEAWDAAHGLQTAYTKGYATAGFSPAIMTIPKRPFTAERTYNEWDRKTPQGTPPTISSTYVIARDSAGRIHYATSRQAGEERVIISDPVAHLQYRYTVTRRPGADLRVTQCYEPLPRGFTDRPASVIPVAYESTSSTGHDEATTYSGQPLAQEQRQHLGTQNLEGLVAYGQERVIRVSSQSRVQTLRTEYWFSPELGISLMEIKDYEGQNLSDVETHRISPTEPDAGLFRPPPGYAVIGEIRSCTGGTR